MKKPKSAKPSAFPVQTKVDDLKSKTPPGFNLEANPTQQKTGESKENTGEPEKAEKLPTGVKSQMENTMGHDFSDVEVKTNSQKAQSMGALAYAQGNSVHFAPGMYKPGDSTGQELIGHELAHVAQQREGRVQGSGVNSDSQLESEADQMGAKAAKGGGEKKPVQLKGKEKEKSSAAPMQAFKMDAHDMRRYPRFTNFVQTHMPKAANDSRVAAAMQKFGTNTGETARDIRGDLEWDKGPKVKPYRMKSQGSFRNYESSDILRIKRQDIEKYENHKDDGRLGQHEMLLESSILHEYTSFLDDQDGKDKWGDEGKGMEKESYGRDIKSIADVKRSTFPMWEEGDYTVTVKEKNAAFQQQIYVWSAESGNGNYDATPGTTFDVKGKEFNKWRMKVKHRPTENDKWQKSQTLMTQESENKWTVRTEDWTDNDRNDLIIEVVKKNNGKNQAS